jgi:hypothetical protein
VATTLAPCTQMLCANPPLFADASRVAGGQDVRGVVCEPSVRGYDQRADAPRGLYPFRSITHRTLRCDLRSDLGASSASCSHARPARRARRAAPNALALCAQELGKMSGMDGLEIDEIFIEALEGSDQVKVRPGRQRPAALAERSGAPRGAGKSFRREQGADGRAAPRAGVV